MIMQNRCSCRLVGLVEEESAVDVMRLVYVELAV
jgi:hypothetical protein